MRTKIYIVTGNHQVPISLEDYFELIKSFFGHEYEIIETKNIIHSNINIIIDEAVDIEFQNKIIHLNQNTKIIYFLTEFITKTKYLKIKSFNFFNSNDLYLILIIIFSKVFRYLEKRPKKKNQKITEKKSFQDYHMPNVKRFIKKIFNINHSSKLLSQTSYVILAVITFFYLFFLYLIKFDIKNLLIIFFKLIRKIVINPLKKFTYFIIEQKLDNFYFYKYMYERYIGYKNIKNSINYFFCSHEKILNEVEFYLKPDQNIFFILNRLNKISYNDKRLITISGENNKYRTNFVNSLNLEYPNNFDEFLKNKFLIKKTFGRYSLNPKKTYKWRYSSPMRYILSIKHNEVPLVTDLFSDNTSNNLFIEIKQEDITTNNLDINYKKFVNQLNSKIEKHNLQMEKVYDKIKNKLNLSIQ